jgi:hypothetical protein
MGIVTRSALARQTNTQTDVAGTSTTTTIKKKKKVVWNLKAGSVKSNYRTICILYDILTN